MGKLRILLSWAGDFLLPLARALLSGEGRTIASIGSDVVSLLDRESDLTGEQKREHAVAMVREALLLRGIEASGWLINAVIEAAVARIRRGSS